MGGITALLGLLPDWLMSVIVASLLWFGVNYLFLAKYHFEGVFEKYAQTHSCTQDAFQEGLQSQKTAMALYTASFKIMENETTIFNRICKQ